MRVQRRLSNQQVVSLDLSVSLGHGGEARVYAVPSDEKLVAKVYHQPTAAHADKLAAMLAKPPDNPMASEGHISIAWPVEILRSVDGSDRIVGFLMPRIRGMRSIIDFYNPKTRRQHCPLFNYQYLHRTARNLAASVAALHACGYCVGDVNESNILISDTALVTLVDTDSFQVYEPENNIIYRCPVGKPEFTPPELQGKSFAECDRTSEHDLFGLAVLIFQLLMEGTHPFSGMFLGSGEPPPYEARILAGHFTYSKQRGVPYLPTRIAPPFKILHPRLQELFVRCFEDGHKDPQLRPSAQDWLAALTEAENTLLTCSVNTQHRYGKHLNSCPWCERSLRLGGRDPFPSPEAVQQGQHLQPRPRKRKTVNLPKKVYPQQPYVITPRVAYRKAYKVHRLKHKQKWLSVIFALLGSGLFGYLYQETSLTNVAVTPQVSPAEKIPNDLGKNVSNKNYANYYQQGYQDYKRRNYEQAIENFTEAIEKNPQNAKAYVNRGNARYNLRDYEGAIGDYDQALQVNPDELKAYVNRGNALYMLASYSGDPDREYKRAIDDYNQALRLDPQEAEAYVRRGIARYEIAQYSGDSKRDYKQAIDDFNQALLINPFKAEAYFRRGVIRYEIAQYRGDFEKDYRQAIEDFNQAISINPNLAPVYIKRGIVRYELAQYGGKVSSTDYVASLDDLLKGAKLFLQEGDMDNYQQALGNICVVLENKCDAFLQNPEKYILSGTEPS